MARQRQREEWRCAQVVLAVGGLCVGNSGPTITQQCCEGILDSVTSLEVGPWIMSWHSRKT